MTDVFIICMDSFFLILRKLTRIIKCVNLISFKKWKCGNSNAEMEENVEI